ncbi:MAG: amidohydrolase family protein [Clostridiales bacterium]|nr:amidohydrolase family protein [Clostridiales bacterium]
MLALINGVLFDGTGSAPVKSAAVLIEGNKIKAAGAGVEIPGGTKIIDLKGKTILPGFIDTHVHAGGTVELRPNWPTFGGAAFSVDYSDARESALRWGVTTLRSAGDYFPDIQEASRKIAEGKLRGPRLYYHGPQIQAHNGHPAGTIWRNDPETCAKAGRYVKTPEEARAAVREIAGYGINYIKTMMCELNIWDYPATVPRLSNEVIAAIVDEAHLHGKRVTIHCERPTDAYFAVSCGAESVEHIFTFGGSPTDVPEDMIPMMVKKGTFVAPTLTGTKAFELTKQEPKDVEYKRYAMVKKIVKDISDAGVRIVVGTDSGAPDVMFGRSAHQEMQNLVDAGVSPKNALLGATRYAAECLGTEKEFGTIEPGKYADVVVVDGDPLTDISATMNIALVIKDGSVMEDRMLSV